MRFVLDLRLGTVHRDESDEPDECRMRPQDLAAALRHPRTLRRNRYEVASVVCDEIPLNGVQAIAVALVAGVQANRFEVVRPEGTASSGRLVFLARALARAVVAMPVELVRTSVALIRVWRTASRRAHLPRATANARSVLYLYRPRAAMGSSTGGAAVHTAGVIEALANRGLDVTVLGPDLPQEVDSCELTFVPVQRRYHLVEWLTMSDYSRALESASADLRASFVYERVVAGSFAGTAVAGTLGVPLVLEFNGSNTWIAENWGGRRLAFSRLASALERRNLRSASLVVVLSNALKDEVVALGVSPERVLVNPVGVDAEELAPLRTDDPAALRRELGLSDVPTVAFIGTFGPWHGVGLLAEMIARTAADHPAARWLLIGGGPLHASVARDIESRGFADAVTLTGVIPRGRAMRLLAAADVCVSPHVPNPDGSRFFGSPTKLFEYMALGKAVVGSDLEQIGEVIDDGRNGLLHPASDAAAAAAAVSRLLADPELRARLGESALHDAVDQYSWAAHVERTLGALEKARHPSDSMAPETTKSPG
jgi:glycosyltransferase involved in cell wall biosynthesis